MAEVFALFARLLGVEDAQDFFAGEDGGEAVGAFCAGEHDDRSGSHDAGDPLHPVQCGLRLRFVATARSGVDGVDRPGLRCEYGVGETLILQGCAPLIRLRYSISPCKSILLH